MFRHAALRTSAVAAAAAATANPSVAHTRAVNHSEAHANAASKFAEHLEETDDGWVTFSEVPAAEREAFTKQETDEAISTIAEILNPGYLSDDGGSSASTRSSITLQSASVMMLAESQMTGLQALRSSMPWHVIAEVAENPQVQAAIMNDPSFRRFFAETAVLPKASTANVLLPALPVEEAAQAAPYTPAPEVLQGPDLSSEFADAVGSARRALLSAARALVDSVVGAFKAALGLFDDKDGSAWEEAQQKQPEPSPRQNCPEPLIRLELTIADGEEEGAQAGSPVRARLIVSRKEKLAHEMSQSQMNDESEDVSAPASNREPAFVVVLTGVFLVFCVVVLRRHGVTLRTLRSLVTSARAAAGSAVIAVAATSAMPKRA